MNQILISIITNLIRKTMKKKFKNIDALVNWMAINGNKDRRYCYSLDVNTCEMEVSDIWIEPSKNKIVRYPKSISNMTVKWKRWHRHISKAFGGYLRRGTVEFIMGEKFVDNNRWDTEKVCKNGSSPERLYFYDRIVALKGMINE